ncbi:hypothetical protein SCHPADRAFT_940361 [Schizopora paradoxa]|uniref:Uncharacterized protein n=1 Tax=Schizopora paradoxa TaxID=27342 RepID=A0A0H2RNK4_9AGAM|nr:hypothetical protein SCHPADRAFT_940361 [Schizopora paradoxa]
MTSNALNGRGGQRGTGRAVSIRVPNVFTKIDKSLAAEAGKAGELARNIEIDAEKVLEHLEDRLQSSSHSVEQWLAINNSLQDTIKRIRKLVVDGRTKGQDAFETFAGHYLSGQDTPSVKLREIDTLIKDLRKDSEDARPALTAVYKSLEKAKTDIANFDRFWPQKNSAFSQELQPRVHSVLENIGILIRGGNKNQSGLGIADSLSLLCSSLSKEEIKMFSSLAHGGHGANIEAVLRDAGSSQTNMINVLDILLGIDKMLYTDILGLRNQYNDYYTRNDLTSFDALYQKTRELYRYLTRATDEFKKAYVNAEAFCGPCGGRVNKEMGAELETHHGTSTAAGKKKNFPAKVSLMKKILRFFGAS